MMFDFRLHEINALLMMSQNFEFEPWDLLHDVSNQKIKIYWRGVGVQRLPGGARLDVLVADTPAPLRFAFSC